MINFILPDTGGRYVLELSNSTLTNIAGQQAANPDLTVTIIMMRRATFASQVAAGRAKLEGNPRVLEQLAGCLVEFDQFFEIMPGTKVPAAKAP